MIEYMLTALLIGVVFAPLIAPIARRCRKKRPVQAPHREVYFDPTEADLFAHRG
jgi:hypothetical protein